MIQLNYIGYGNHNSFLGSSTLALLVILFYFRVFIVGIFKIFLIITKEKFGGYKLYLFLKRNLFFNFILSVFLEGFFEFVINGYINAQQLLWDLNGELLGSFFAIKGLLMTLIVIPLLMLWINCIKNKY